MNKLSDENRNSKSDSDILKEAKTQTKDNFLNIKDNSIPKNNNMKPHYLNKGNVYMFYFNKTGIPRIVIGPNCKNNSIKL